MLSPQMKAPFEQYANQLTSAFADRPTPTPLPSEQKAFGMMEQGIAPTPESLKRDLSMLMNPFDESVISGINKEAQGQNSLLNQLATRAGQQGSSRVFAGTGDIEQNRLDSIGRFKQGQFNTAIGNILGGLSRLKQGDIGNLLAQGQLERGMPFSDLKQFGNLLGALPQSGGSTGNARKGGSGSNFMDTAMNVGKILGGFL